MKNYLFLFILLLILHKTFGQEQNIKLLGESGDGKTVKLIWFLKEWEKATIGFNVMRRTINNNKKGSWEKMNSSTIQPGISIDKPLQIVEPDANELNRLKTKLQTLIAKRSMREISTQDYLQRLRTDPRAIEGVAYATALDFDVALINGFAFVDRTTVEGNNYEYGLALVKENSTTDNPVATFSWISGSVPPLDIQLQLRTRATANNKQLQLRWKVDPAQLKQINAAGFNVYKQSGSNWMKLNYGPIAIAPGTGEYTFMDSTANAVASTTYAVALQTIFGNEGKRVQYMHDPSLHPLEYKTPELDTVKSTGVNFDEGFHLKWTFDATQEKFIKGFSVEKANLPAPYQTVSATVPPNQRSFLDTSYSPPASYVQFRITALYNDEQKTEGNEKLYYYLPIKYAPKPENIRGQWLKDKDSTYINLTWDAKKASDSLTDGYYLYALNPADGKVYLEGSIPLIKTNSYRYPVFNTKATNYRFTIAAVSKYKSIGRFSDTVAVMAPTTILPIPVIAPYSLDTGRVTLQWQYEDIADLKGFRVFQNGNLVASEYELKKDARRFVSPVLKFNDTYAFTIQAVTEAGIESPLSMPRNIYIFTRPKG